MGRRHTKSSFSSVFVAAVATGTCFVPLRAQAQRPEDVESAKISFTQGLELREKGDETGALAKFRAAYALLPTPITGLEVGRSLISTGHILEGRAILLDVSHMPKKAGESEKAQESRETAEVEAEAARPKLATLTVETDPSVDPTVTVDEVMIPKDATQAPRVLDPGHHVIVVRTHGKFGRAEVDLAPGEQHQVHIEADHDEHPAPPPPVVTRVRYHPGAPFWASVVVTGAGLALGVGAGVTAIAMTTHLAGECPARACPPSAHGDLDTSLALGWASTIGLAVAGAGAIAAIITYATSGRRETVAAPTASVRVEPGLGSLFLRGEF